MNKKIAIIDDEQEILDVLSRFLARSKKFDITTFSNPKLALDSIKSTSYDLILVDIMMPQMNGLDLLKEIKNSNPDIKVIMMTAYLTLDKVIELKNIGAEDYITKPFASLREVENKIDDNLGL